MALSLATEMLDAIASGDVARALMVEFKTDGGTRRAWNQEGNITESVILSTSTTWTGLGERMKLGGGITMASDLQGETVTLALDASRINDNSDFVGALTDDVWHQREIVIREVLFTSNFAAVIGVLNTWYALMDKDEFAEFEEGSTWVLSCESGAFEFFRTNQFRRTDSNQQSLAPGDLGFAHTAVQTVQLIPFGTNNLVGR
jgi:hypothetical protein